MSTALLERRDEIPDGYFLVDCAVSGGTLEAFLRSALAASGGRLCAELRCHALEFPLPCLSGQGTPLTSQQLSGLTAQHRVFFSEALGTSYLTCCKENRLHCVLFDTLESLQYKLTLCRKLGIPLVLIQDHALLQHIRK